LELLPFALIVAAQRTGTLAGPIAATGAIMNHHRILATLLATVLLCLTVPAVMADQPNAPQMSMEELKSRLNLTPEQQSKIQPHADTRNEKFKQAHDKMTAAASKHDKRAAMHEAKLAQDDFVRNVEPILTPDQQAEWKKMRTEARDKMKERWRERNQ
jgi:hypothetical protein